MRFIQRDYWNAIIIGVLLLGAATRTLLYGDMRFSVANGETYSYIESSVAPLFSWGSFAGKRLFTTNLVFKLANDPIACPLTALSSPAEGREVEPALQPCFDRIALLQHLLSILGWCFLAWTTSRWLRHPVPKIGIAVLLLVFGFTPQIVEWDSVLSPESLATSLFVGLLALLQELMFQVGVRKHPIRSPLGLSLLGGSLLVFALWLFTRDVHLYAVPATVALLGIVLIVADAGQRKVLTAIIAILIGLFILGYYSARESRRATRYPLVHVFDEYILPYPDRVAFFQRIGMPDPASPEYPAWLDENATQTYSGFLLAHPGFVVTRVVDNLNYFRGEFVQQYFRGTGTRYRVALLAIGEMLHPETNGVYLLDLLLFMGLCVVAIERRDARLYVWTWLAAWVLVCSSIILMASYFGDAEAFRRHLYTSVEAFRLLMWMLLLVLLDEVITRTPGAAWQETAGLRSVAFPTGRGE